MSSREEDKAKQFAFNYGSSGAGLLRGKPATAEEALVHLKRYQAAYGSTGWKRNNPIAQAEHRRGLRIARLIFAAQVALGIFGLSLLLKVLGAVVAAFTPGAGHGF